MADSDMMERLRANGVRWAYRTVNGIFVAAMLSTIAFEFIDLLGDKAASSSEAWIYGYGMVAALIVAVVLSLGLLAHAIATRTLAFIKWPFVLFALTALLLNVNRDVTNQLTDHDIVRLHLRNESGASIKWIEVFGRGESADVDSIAARSEAVVSYRGRKINNRTRDKFSNRIGIRWFDAGRMRERILVDQSTVVPDSLTIVFSATDSVLVAKGPPAGITK